MKIPIGIHHMDEHTYAEKMLDTDAGTVSFLIADKVIDEFKADAEVLAQYTIPPDIIEDTGGAEKETPEARLDRVEDALRKAGLL